MELAEGTEPGEQMKEKYMQANYQFVCMYFFGKQTNKSQNKKRENQTKNQTKSNKN